MADDHLTALAHDLGVDPTEVAFLAAVDTDTVAALHTAFRDARARQERELAEAFEGSITLVPRPLRGRVRKLLVGS